jgi:photosystem II stability/assembly factor-like uncharacterized protein
MRLKAMILFALILSGFSCRKSNYVPPVYPLPPDSLMSWNIISTLSGQDLSDIWFTSATRGFTLGDKIYQTNDGGLNWAAIPNTSEITNFLNLFFVSPQTGFAQGSSQLATTVDGGNTWAVKPLLSANGLTIFFVDPSVGFYGDESGGGLNKTVNAGNSWTTVYADPGTTQCYYPFFLDVDTGYVATGTGTFASTSDGGLTWQTKSVSLPVNQNSYTYNQLFFSDKNIGFYACPSGVMKTADGGQSWQNVLIDSIDGSFSNTANVVKFLDANTGYYKGSRAIYKTSDGGKTWSLNCKVGADYLIGMYFLDVHNGWACTSKGRILRIQIQQ